MAFVIPNATQTALSAPFVTLDQSEPDSLDFEILGNTGRSGVISGCGVAFSSGTSVSVASGEVLIDGVYYVTPSSTITLPAAPTNKRFDLIVARASGGSVSAVVLSGNDDATNFEFPTSKGVDSIGGTVDFSTDVVLAAVFRNGSTAITAGNIADRRTTVKSVVVGQGTSLPSASFGSTGTLYFKRDASPGGVSSGLYIKNASGNWVDLAQNFGPQVPAGSIVAWASRGALPTGWLECDGSEVSRTTYAELYEAIGTIYGSTSSSTFKLPDLRSRHLRGSSTINSTGTNVGQDSFTLNVAQLPNHSHSLASHTHTLSHTHGIGHNHTVTSDNQDTNHTHTAKSGAVASQGNFSHTGGDHSHSHGNYSGSTNDSGDLTMAVSGNSETVTAGHIHEVGGAANSSFAFVRRLDFYANVNGPGTAYRIPDLYYDTVTNGMSVDFTYTTDFDSTSSNSSEHNHGDGNYSASGAAHSHNLDVNSGFSGTAGGHSHNLSFTLNNQSSSHKHGISVNGQTTNDTSSQSAATTSGPSENDTGPAGSGSSVSTIPASTYVRWLIRTTGTVNALTPSGVDVLTEAREEVVTVELSGSGALPASETGAAYYRMPWAATLTAVKANRNGTNSNGSVSIDIKEDGTTVLGTALTIDQNESSSSSASIPAVISDSDIDDDALITFDINSANTSDEGPLTVTLYFTRED